MGNRKEDLQYMHAKLRMYEERRELVRQLLAGYADTFTLAKIAEHLEREIENIEWCLQRDRINHDKPE